MKITKSTDFEEYPIKIVWDELGCDIDYITEEKAKELHRRLGAVLFGSNEEAEDDSLTPFNKLADYGIECGDIIVDKKNRLYLLRNGFPEEFNTALCCERLSDGNLHLYQIGFHWCDSTDSLKFRKATDEERQEFTTACINALKEKIDEHTPWELPQYSEILHSLYKWKLVSEKEYKQLNIELKNIHNADLIKFYKNFYG